MIDPYDKYRKMIEDMLQLNSIANSSSWDFFHPQMEQQKRDLDYELIEDEKTARFVFEVAGMEKEEIDIELIDDLLVVKGDNQKKSFEYKIGLKSPLVNPKATYTNGILEIVFEKTLKESKKIKIQ